MLEEIATSKFGFWIVATIIAAIDSAFLLKPGSFAFSISRDNQTNLRASPSPFTLKNKELASSLLCFPFQMFFISDIRAPHTSKRQTLNALSSLGRLAGQTRALSALAVLAALALIAGPCVAFFWGVQKSIIIFLPLLYISAMAASIALWKIRATLDISKGAALKMSAEMMLCPVLLINIAKRLSLTQGRTLNVLDIAAHTRSPHEARVAVRENMSYYHGE